MRHSVRKNLIIENNTNSNCFLWIQKNHDNLGTTLQKQFSVLPLNYLHHMNTRSFGQSN